MERTVALPHGRAEALALLGLRLTLVPLFYFSGIGKVMNFAGTAARLPGGEVVAAGLTAGAIAVELGVSSLLLLGIRARACAAILILFTVAATLMFHNFWASPPAQTVMQTVNFLKNVGLVGALLTIAAFGAGPYAVGRRTG